MPKIQELINRDGTRIGSNNVKLSVDNSKSASNSTMDPMFDQNGNQLKNASVQSTRQQGYRGYYSLVPMPSVKTPVPIISYMSDEDWWDDIPGLMKDLKKETGEDITDKDLINFDDHTGNQDWEKKKDVIEAFLKWWKDKPSKLKESSKKKMKDIVEDIISAKKFPKDVLDKFKEKTDLDKNGIPDIDIVSEENPILVRKVKNLMDIIQKNQANGEQKGIILNFLINNINVTDIPVEYKQELLKKLK